MIFSTRFNVVLDACVLYPAPIRDLLLNLAEQELYAPKWSEIIQEEWLRNLLLNRPDLKRRRLNRTVKAMNSAYNSEEMDDLRFILRMLKAQKEMIIELVENLED